MGLHPRVKKRWGQHFLHDTRIVERIIACVDEGALPVGDEEVVEIGPGRGVLTDHLLQRYGDHFWALEVDKELHALLQSMYATMGRRLVLKDCLQFDFSQIPERVGGITLVGNLPYNISSRVLYDLVYKQRERVRRAVFMVQREVGERIAAAPGGRVCGLLSVLLQAYYRVEVLFRVSKGSFTPPPKVDSVVVKLQRLEGGELGCSAELFTQVVKASFAHRRKTLRNSLLGSLDFSALQGGLPEDIPYGMQRAEQLGVSEYVELTNYLYSLGVRYDAV